MVEYYIYTGFAEHWMYRMSVVNVDDIIWTKNPQYCWWYININVDDIYGLCWLFLPLCLIVVCRGWSFVFSAIEYTNFFISSNQGQAPGLQVSQFLFCFLLLYLGLNNILNVFLLYFWKILSPVALINWLFIKNHTIFNEFFWCVCGGGVISAFLDPRF